MDNIKRVILKLSGEALAKKEGVQPATNLSSPETAHR